MTMMYSIHKKYSSYLYLRDNGFNKLSKRFKSKL